MSEDLDALRARIDEVDRRLLELLIERAEAAREVGALKAGSGASVLDPGRERELLERLLARNAGRYPPGALTAVYREILSASRALEAPMTVGYLGAAGGFAEAAARRRFGASSSVSAYRDPAALLRDLDGGRLQYALLARDVGDEDPALDSFDLFLDTRVTLFGEVVLRQGYALLGSPGGAAPAFLHGHPAALARCGELISRHAGASVLAAAGSREAAEAANRPGHAALAPPHLADGKAREVLEERAEDETDPVRRFLILARSRPPRSGRDRTALVCVLPNRPGALAGLLAAFADAGANVAWIEIRVSRHRPWEHAFFLETDGHAEDAPVGRALEAAARMASHLQVLGSYPVESAG